MIATRPLLPIIQNASRPVAPRFWGRVDRRGPSECWLWKGSVNAWGYGQFGIGEESLIASRVAWALSNNSEPGMLIVCHTCDIPACCNPAHLFLGTVADNHRDMMSKGRWHASPIKGEKHKPGGTSRKGQGNVEQSHIRSSRTSERGAV